MSLKEDIESMRSAIYATLDRHASSLPIDTINQLMDSQLTLSRIEAALAVDDGPPREGDVVVFPGFPHREFALVQIFHYDFEGQQPIILMRAEEVTRRIKEAGK